MLNKLKTVVNLVLVCIAIQRTFTEFKKERAKKRDLDKSVVSVAKAGDRRIHSATAHRQGD